MASKAAAFLATMIVVGTRLIPRLLSYIASWNSRELFLLSVTAIGLGVGYATYLSGLSFAFGAFVAGMILSESEYSHQALSEIIPLRDIFGLLFFVSVGMLLDPSFLFAHIKEILLLVLLIIVGKGFIFATLVRFFGYGNVIPLAVGFGLFQIGEFSFVLAGVGRSNGLLGGDIFQAFVASSILTILATPFLIQAGPSLAARGEKALPWRKRAAHVAAKPVCDLEGHVIIAGYGLNGRNLAHVLKEAGIRYFIIELNPVTVREAAAEGEPIIFGDVSSRTILGEAGVRRAKGIVFAISDPLTTRLGVKAARELNPGLFIIVRTRYSSEIDELLALGADEVIPEEFETSIEIFTRVLERYHVPRNLVTAQVKVLRGECYGLLRGACAARPTAERIADLLAAGTAETYFVGQGAWPARKTLGELDLRGRTGATVIAVVRGEESFPGPGADFEVGEQDTLVLMANHRDIDRAFHYLTTGEPDGPGAARGGA